MMQASKNQKQLANIVSQHWKNANQLHNKVYHNSSQTAASTAMNKIKVCIQLSDLLLGYYLQQGKSLDSEEKKKENLEEKKKQYMRKIYENLDQQWKIGKLPVAFVLGYSVFQQMLQIDLFSQIKSKVEQLMEKLNPVKKLEFDLSEQSSDQDFPNFYNINNSDMKKKQKSLYKQKQEKVQQFEPQQNTFQQSTKIGDDLDDSGFFTDNDLTLQFLPEQEEVNSDLILNENPEIRQYLNQLSKATTQLSYLCQHMKWSQPNSSDKKSQINDALYSSVIQVIVRVKDKVFILSGNCSGAISKKQARRIASLFVLRKIYNKFPEVWSKFRILRELNQGIQQPLNVNNQQIFKKANLDVLNMSFFKQQKRPFEEAGDGLGGQINQYLDSLPSYKNELNILIGRYKEVSPPNLQRDKQDEMGLWPVNASINDGTIILKSQAKQISKKKAEQKCCRDLLFALYRRNMKRYDAFMDYKKSKSL